MKSLQRIFLLLISTLLVSFSFLSNISIGYAEEYSNTKDAEEGSSYFLIHYNGEEQEVAITEEVTLLLSGWADEDKSSVNGKIMHSTNQSNETMLVVSEQLNNLNITEDEHINYRITVSDKFNAEKVTPLELSDQSTVVEENDNGTSIEETTTIDEYGTVIENQGLFYFLTDVNNQKVEITVEEYNSLNAIEEITTEDKSSTIRTSPIERSAVSKESASLETDVRTSISVQSNSTTTAGNPSVVYSTHVQTHGWMEEVTDGKMSGTYGQSKRLEAIKISLKNAPYSGDITYKTHVQQKGWLNNVLNGVPSGTSGESKRLEAIQINLTGEMAKHYDVYYRVHAQTYGWLDWAKNGQSAGTQALSKRLEAIEIVLVKKGGAAPGKTTKPFVIDPKVSYSTHIQSYGWSTPVTNGITSGTSGESKRLEAIKISLKNKPYTGDITYKTYVQTYGWLDSVSNGALAGTSGKSKRMEAIEINLTGEMAQRYDIYYRVHAQTYGWLGWAKNGESAGTKGLSKRLEAIQIVLVEKGGAAPGPTTKPLVIDPAVSYSTYVQGNGWVNAVSNGIMSGTMGESKRLEAIKISLHKKPYTGDITYKTYVDGSGWLNSVSNGAISGIAGSNKRIEAIEINLTGEMAQHYDIYYRVNAQSYGWLDWAKNGQSAGTEALSKQVEAIEMVLVDKGGAAPGPTSKPFVKPSLIKTTNNYNLTLNAALDMQMKVSPQTDKYRFDPAYVSGEYLEMFDGGSITGSSVNLRTSTDLRTNLNIAKTVGNGTAFLVLDNNVTGDSVSGNTKWYKIEYDGQVLYVHSSLAKINSRIGKVKANNLMIRAEKNGSSHIYGSAKKDRLLTVLEEDTKTGWYQVSIGNWRNAKAADVQVFLDPTNYVNDEKQRLQFMNLTKPSDVSVETLNKYLAGKDKLANQGQAFIDAGNKYGINDVYLLAHTLLETGHGKSTLAKGVTYNGRTVYNMYGIGAYDSCPVECGAKTAYEKGWFTPYDAIVGGAEFISDEYLGGNNYHKTVQNTLYEMRWNPESMSVRSAASHQYATDIGWAYKQVNVMYEIYEMEPFTLYLEIPTYK
ncbi:glucosaminidase domain-containing protein [Litchfieldia alkalitelluris]|uniref:glucosaminidase domain-containing protein n=1 Tax=Litchfieldia alkalitelluris TaxID=304268 RepID=UPI000998E76E|nr:glucosaminidase domain-containing protein [Litchfieldia alkalitelluris]